MLLQAANSESMVESRYRMRTPLELLVACLNVSRGSPSVRPAPRVRPFITFKCSCQQSAKSEVGQGKCRFSELMAARRPGADHHASSLIHQFLEVSTSDHMSLMQSWTEILSVLMDKVHDRKYLQ